MEQAEGMNGDDPAGVKEPARVPAIPSKHYLISKKVTDHLANERTFLAWVRTGLSIIAFGFVVERFGLLLRELGLKVNQQPVFLGHYSTLIGIALTLLGTVVLVVVLCNFLQALRSINKEQLNLKIC